MARLRRVGLPVARVRAVPKISAQELVELVPCSLERPRRLQDLGVLATREEGGLFPSSDAHVVRLIAAFEEKGISTVRPHKAMRA